MSSACENSPRFCQPSTVMMELCETVCDDCWVFTPGRYTEIGRVVTVPPVVTTQCAAVTTMRLVHNAPLHELLPLMRRTTAVLPSADVPPTTAFAGCTPADTDAANTAMPTNVRRTTLFTRSGYENSSSPSRVVRYARKVRLGA